MFSWLDRTCIKCNKCANKLIRTIGVPLSDYFFGIFLKTNFNFFRFFKFSQNTILSKYISFSKFSKSISKFFYCLKIVVMSFFYIFEGPNVNEIISYFRHLYYKILNLIMCKKINLFSGLNYYILIWF
jgi:hypothetical protein